DELPRRERTGADALEERPRAHEVGVVVRQDRPGEAGGDDLTRGLDGIEAAAERRLDDADPATELRHRDTAQPASENERTAAARTHLRRCDAQRRRLPGAVRSEQRPVLAPRHGPLDG